MKTLKNDDLDKLRNRQILGFLIGWVLWYGTLIMRDYISNKTIFNILLSVGLIGNIIFVFYIIKLIRLSNFLNKNDEKKKALNDELWKENSSKSFSWGFILTMFTTIFLLVISVFCPLSAIVICEIILFVGVVSFLSSFLIFNRN